MKSAFITGVSSGIGGALAEMLVNRDWKVFGSVRKAEQGTLLAEKLGANFVPMIFDVVDEPAVNAAAGMVRSQLSGRRLDVLVNNAGAVLAGPLELQATEEFRRQLDINLVGPFITAKALIPLLGSDLTLAGMPGRIINVSSMAGKIGVPFMGAYAASKHGLEGYSDSLRCELAQYGIDVVTVTPGSVATQVFAKAQETANPYSGSSYEHSFGAFLEGMKSNVGEGHSPTFVAKGILKAIENPKPKCSYEIIWRKLAYWRLPRLMSKRALMAAMCSRYGLPMKLRNKSAR